MCGKSWRLLLLPLAFALSLCAAAEADACSCRFGGGAPCEDFWRADAVFVGTVVGESKVSVEEGAYKETERLVRLTVVQPLRGVEGPEAEVRTGWGGGDCGYGFVQGMTYVVYAYRGKDGRLATSICTRTRPAAKADEDLAYARGLAASDAGALLFGQVVKRNYTWKEGQPAFLPVAGAELTIEGAAGSSTVRTDTGGNYRAAGLAPGTYHVRLKTPEGLTDGREGDRSTIEREAEVAARGCAEAGFYLEAETRVSGRVVDAEGRAVAGLPLEMRGANADRSNVNSFHHAKTDKEGRFEFTTVPPGDYLLGFRVLSYGNEHLPFPRTYYPGVASKDQAKVITVNEGERLSDLELHMPPRLAERSVEGAVVWADGRPAPGAYIYLTMREGGDTSSNQTLRADERGHFTLKLYEGQSYVVSAYPQGASGPAAQSPWTEVPQGGGPIKLVLPAPKN